MENGGRGGWIMYNSFSFNPLQRVDQIWCTFGALTSLIDLPVSNFLEITQLSSAQLWLFLTGPGTMCWGGISRRRWHPKELSYNILSSLPHHQRGEWPWKNTGGFWLFNMAVTHRLRRSFSIRDAVFSRFPAGCSLTVMEVVDQKVCFFILVCNWVSLPGKWQWDLPVLSTNT